jgi:hypothetical protein
MGKHHNPLDIEWWRNKIIHKIDGKAFNRTVGIHAISILEQLVDSPKKAFSASSLAELATQFRVPTKFLSRSLGLLSRHRLINLNFDGKIKIAVNKDRSALPRRRRSISLPIRKNFFEIEGYKCAHCLKQFNKTNSLKELRIDHIVPFSMLGADSIQNWSALCKSCNREKMHDFDTTWLRYHHNKPVKNLRVQFRNGEFLPIVK